MINIFQTILDGIKSVITPVTNTNTTQNTQTGTDNTSIFTPINSDSSTTNTPASKKDKTGTDSTSIFTPINSDSSTTNTSVRKKDKTDAQTKVSKAQQNVERVNSELEAAKAELQAAQETYDSAIADLESAKAEASRGTSNKTTQEEIEKNALTFLDRVFGRTKISGSNPATISRSNFSKLMGENYGGSYATQATIDMAREISPNSEKLNELEGITDKKELAGHGQEIKGDNTPKVGDIVLTGVDGNVTHSGVVVGYDNGKLLVAEASTTDAGANGGAAVVAYDINCSKGKTILSYIPLNEENKEVQEDKTQAVEEAQRKVEQAQKNIDQLNDKVSQLENKLAQANTELSEAQTELDILKALEEQEAIIGEESIIDENPIIDEAAINDESEKEISEQEAKEQARQLADEKWAGVQQARKDLEAAEAELKAAQEAANKATSEEIQKNANNFISKVFGTAKTISRSVFGKKMGENYGGSYATQAAIDMAREISPNSEKLDELEGITDKKELAEHGQEIKGDNTPKVGDIVLTGVDGNVTHSGVVVGYDKNGKLLVAEGSSTQADGGAIIASYDINASKGKRILSYIPINEQDDRTKTEKSEAIAEAERKVQEAQAKLETLETEFEEEYQEQFVLSHLSYLKEQEDGNKALSLERFDKESLDKRIEELKDQVAYTTQTQQGKYCYYDSTGKLLFTKTNGRDCYTLIEYDNEGRISRTIGYTLGITGKISTANEVIYTYSDNGYSKTNLSYGSSSINFNTYSIDSNEQIEDCAIQGMMGDCYFISAAHGAAKTQAGKRAIDEAINVNESGDFEVTIYDKNMQRKTVTITRDYLISQMILDDITERNLKAVSVYNERNKDCKQEAGHAIDDVDLWLLELAYMEVYSGSDSETDRENLVAGTSTKGKYSDSGANALEGGWLSDFTKAFFGKKATEIKPNRKNPQKSNTKVIDFIRQHGQDKNYIIEFYDSTNSDSESGMCLDVNGKKVRLCPGKNQSHGTEIISGSYNPKTDTVLISDPNSTTVHEVPVSELETLWCIGIAYFDTTKIDS